MRKERKNKSNFGKAGVLLSLFFIGMLSSVLVMAITMQPVVEQQVIESTKYWHPPLGVNHPGGDNGGYTYFMAYPHTADPTGTYDANLSTSNAYEESDLIGEECANETPHSTTYDYVMGLVVNDTTSFNSSGNTWETDWIAANITVDFDFASDVAWTNMTLMLITNTTSFAWYNCYINNSGAGYQITNNEKWNATVNVSLWW